MDRLKKYLLPAAGVLTLTAVLDMTPAGQVMAQASKDIVVSNSPSQPIPTKVQTLPPITGDVTITNTPTVNLQTGSTVGINPFSNTVRIGSNVPVFNLDDAFRVLAEPAILMSFPGQAFVKRIPVNQ